MRNFIQILSKSILVIAFLNIFAFLVLYVSEGRNIGVFTKPIKEFSEFPRLIKNVIREARFPKGPKVDPDFQALNKLKYDVFTLNSTFDNSKWIISLTNLRNDSTIYRWYLKEKDFLNNTKLNFSRAYPVNPILLQDKSIILMNWRTSNLFRLNRESKVIWHNTDHLVHHSMNLDNEGNVWVCTRKNIDFLEKEKKYGEYSGDYITKIDAENGNTLYSKSVREILVENDLAYLVYGIANQIRGKSFDPLHLNDIEPVLKDGPYWKAGDLFISCRSISTVLLFRPSSNRVLRIIGGPFLSQHDVDIQSDSTILIFNNNVSHLGKIVVSENLNPEYQPIPNPLFNKISNVLKYNLNDSTFMPIYQNQFINNNIKTPTQGLQHELSSGDMFVESTDEGKVYIFNEKEVLFKRYLNQVIDNHVELPKWTRVYENINF